MEDLEYKINLQILHIRLLKKRIINEQNYIDRNDNMKNLKQ
jgi:hypothetical protein